MSQLDVNTVNAVFIMSWIFRFFLGFCFKAERSLSFQRFSLQAESILPHLAYLIWLVIDILKDVSDSNKCAVVSLDNSTQIKSVYFRLSCTDVLNRHTTQSTKMCWKHGVTFLKCGWHLDLLCNVLLSRCSNPAFVKCFRVITPSVHLFQVKW